MTEPNWARKFRFWLHDDSPDWVGDHLAYPVMTVMCHLWGQGVIDDQCDRPEHRFCWRCNKAMPYASVDQ